VLSDLTLVIPRHSDKSVASAVGRRLLRW